MQCYAYFVATSHSWLCSCHPHRRFCRRLHFIVVIRQQFSLLQYHGWGCCFGNLGTISWPWSSIMHAPNQTKGSLCDSREVEAATKSTTLVIVPIALTWSQLLRLLQLHFDAVLDFAKLFKIQMRNRICYLLYVVVIISFIYQIWVHIHWFGSGLFNSFESVGTHFHWFLDKNLCPFEPRDIILRKWTCISRSGREK